MSTGISNPPSLAADSRWLTSELRRHQRDSTRWEPDVPQVPPLVGEECGPGARSNTRNPGPTLQRPDHEANPTPAPEGKMKENCAPDRPLMKDETHRDRLSLFLTAMSVGVFTAVLMATGKSEPGRPKAAGLMPTSIRAVGTTMTTIMTIYAPRNADHAETLRSTTVADNG